MGGLLTKGERFMIVLGLLLALSVVVALGWGLVILLMSNELLDILAVVGVISGVGVLVGFLYWGVGILDRRANEPNGCR